MNRKVSIVQSFCVIMLFLGFMSANSMALSGKGYDGLSSLGHPLIPDMVADPSIVEIDGVFYCYATTDGAGAGLASAGLPVVWTSKDFVNWSFSGSLFADNYDAKYWAPSTSIKYQGKYYLFPTLNEKITTLRADSPLGPFRTVDGKDINNSSGWSPFPIRKAKPIDAEVFIDDDGKAYMVWAQRGLAQLNSELTDTVGEQIVVNTKRNGYSEGSFLFKRNGIYYFMYTLSGHEAYKYAYMMSYDSPLGPWVAPERDIIAGSDYECGLFGPGHGSFFSPADSDQWYFVYLEYGRGGCTRQIWADKMNFNPDGTIVPVKLTLAGVGALGASEGRANLALGKAATSSPQRPDLKVIPRTYPKLDRYENFIPANAIDDSNATRWLATDGGDRPWFMIDLGKKTAVSSTELYFVKPTWGHAYKLEYSIDGQSWLPYGGSEKLVIKSPHVDSRAVKARFLKCTILEGEPGIWEFKVY